PDQGATLGEPEDHPCNPDGDPLGAQQQRNHPARSPPSRVAGRMLVGRLRRVPEESASGAPLTDQRPVQDWRALLAIYAVTALIESTGVSQVFAFLPLRLHQMGLRDAEVASFTGIFTALIFVFGIFLVPFWGVWADKYSRRAVIVRSGLVEMVVFAGVALAR